MLREDTDYTVTSCSNNVNAGTTGVTIVGKGYYTGTRTVNFTIAKANQSISGGKSFTRGYGARVFSLGAKAKTALTYKSANTRVAAGRNYNAAVKKVNITVTPKKWLFQR